ncbi:MAG: hypothetical protein HKL85_02130 [Acidimicrobiaceae bacterium]|nr:hypothetical protein [Acidimicrobiaceae bacterium]
MRTTEVEPPASSDDDRQELDSVLESVRERITYLRASAQPVDVVTAGTNVVTDGAYIACATLIDDPIWLRALIMQTGHQLGTDDPMMAASLFIQSYSYRILTLAIACATISGVVPDSSAPAMAIALKGGRVSLVAYTRPAVFTLALPGQSVSTSLLDRKQMAALFDIVHTRAIDLHLGPLIDSVRSTIRVGERLLWGNVAASLAVAFRTMEGCLGEWVQEIGNYFVDHSPRQLTGLGSFLVLQSGDRRGWFWERTNCCLYDRLPGDIRCADCSRTPSISRREAYLATLNEA